MAGITAINIKRIKTLTPNHGPINAITVAALPMTIAASPGADQDARRLSGVLAR